MQLTDDQCRILALQGQITDLKRERDAAQLARDVARWGVYAEQETVCLERSSDLVELFLKYFGERDWKMRLRNGLVLFVSSAYSKDAGKFVQLVIKEERDDTVR